MNDQIDIHFQNAQTSIVFDIDFDINNYFNKDEVIIITDSNIMNYYSDSIQYYRTIIVDNGEDCKSHKSVCDVIDKLLEYKADRSTHLIGFGGGALCDLTGYTASIYMRGLQHSFIPTSLLAMIDASFGGKNAVNINKIKNLIGTFKHPEKVIIHTGFLNTLPDIEYNSGLAELIKIAIIADVEMLDLIENNNIYNKQFINKDIVFNAILRKSEIVIKDEYDHGVRQLLNFGHTLGHLIEFEHNIPHGAAVIKGMRFAVELSRFMGFIDIFSYDRLKYILQDNDKNDVKPDYEKLIKKAFSDKKRRGKYINFIFVNSICDLFIHKLEIEELEFLCLKMLNQKYV